MITAGAAFLLVIAWLTHEPTEQQLARRNLRRMKREQYDLNPALRGRW